MRSADLSVIDRTGALHAMAAEGVDVLVIGGGITGAGVALDAATRGFRVGLVDQGDFGAGTSSRSTKLVHGGIRYLPHFDLSLVREALIERARLAANAPHLVRPLPFLVPFYRDLTRPLGIHLPAPARPLLPMAINLGLWFYDRLAGGMVLIRHRPVSLAEALQMFPYLRREGLRRASLYYDAQTDDARLTVAVLRTARLHGARCVNYARAVQLVRSSGRVSGVEVEDLLGGSRYRIPTRWVINAAGVWAQEVSRMAGTPQAVQLTLSKGVHLVLPRELVGVGNAALVLPETEDGRLAFIVPWEGRAVLGTTDTPYSGSMEQPPVTREDVEYLLRHARRFLNVELEPGDVLGAYAGLRPLVSAGGRSADISRRHAVVRHEPGFISIIGGKLTTYRRMAEDVVDVVAREEARAAATGSKGADPLPCRTERLVFVGGEEPESWPHLVRDAIRMGLAPSNAERLLRTYGAELGRLLELIREDPALGEPIAPGVPYVAAEVVFACRSTMATNLEDLMVRRLRLALVDPRASLEAAANVARLMGETLGWSTGRQGDEVEQYRSALAYSSQSTARSTARSHPL